MWRKVFVCFLFFLWPMLALNLGYLDASPWLVCDPVVNVETYELDLNGVVQTGIPITVGYELNGRAYLTDPGGGKLIHLLRDLAGTPNGAYSAKARGVNMWGVSQWSDPFGFDAAKPGAPGVRLDK
jgi:hypothetical protein